MKLSLSSVIEKIQFFIQHETFVILGVITVVSYLIYKLFLKEISLKRHTNLKNRFKTTSYYLITSFIFSMIHWTLSKDFNGTFLEKISDYSAFVTLAILSMTVIKVSQIVVYLYLFYQNISQGIPRLIANLFTFVFSIFVYSYLASEIFNIQVTAMLATSAVFSLVLGLALQDTLGNLFSGVAIQIGQPFKIGDWVEITSDSKKWLGQIQEITWRATFLTSFADEWIMIPNKTLAQGQIIIYNNQIKPNRESLVFRIDFHQDIARAKKVLHELVAANTGVMNDPAPRVLLTETTESWAVMKVFYSVHDFSLKYRIADQILDSVILGFRKEGLQLAQSKISVTTSPVRELE